MTAHRDQVESAIKEYGHLPRHQLPEWLRSPRNEHEFALGVSVYVEYQRRSGSIPGVLAPVYDENNMLYGWVGVMQIEAEGGFPHE